MDKQPSSASSDAGIPPVDELAQDLEVTHEVAQRGHQLLETSKELTNSSKALLEQLDPIL